MTIGEYVSRTHAASGVGTYTGVAATTRGADFSDVAQANQTGRYTQSSPRRAAVHTTTGSHRFGGSVLTHR